MRPFLFRLIRGQSVWQAAAKSGGFGGQKVDAAELDALEADQVLRGLVDFAYLPA